MRCNNLWASLPAVRAKRDVTAARDPDRLAA
jgi:hypothetical protein